MIYEKITICPDGKESAVLTCMRKENTTGKPEAVRKAVILCPGGGYEFCSSREAVSYTHLDVYKRQMYRSWPAMMPTSSSVRCMMRMRRMRQASL